MKFRTYHQVEGSDASRLAEQVAAQRRRVEERLGTIGRVVAIMSGKGGVGKSYVTAAIALGLADRLPGGVGVLDADLKGPTAARLLGASGPVRLDQDGVHPAPGQSGVKVFSMDLLLEDGQPLRWNEPAHERFVWRGVLETGALREFLADVVWGSLDLLLVDLPPGADRLEDLAELVPHLAGALAISIPSEESRRSVERAMRSALRAKVKLLGVIENMSGYACGQCGRTGPLFPGNAGPALAEEFGVPLVAKIPFHSAPYPPAELKTLTDALAAVIR
ncbi:MAG TPA: P-loop NTPase [Gemmatimonadales bacterium]|nr:P-loop NTPase [Gemmatimonadales bacterium]